METEYLGFGNFLVVKSDFWKEFNDIKDSYKGDKFSIKHGLILCLKF